MKSIKIFRNTLFAAAALVFFNACVSTTQESVVFEAMASAEGPFFEGPNSLMAEYTVNLEELLNSQDYSLEDFEQVSIKDVSIALMEDEELSTEDFTSVSLSIVSANEPMTGIATLNPISGNSNDLTLSSSDEVDLAPFFKEGSFTLVVDWDFMADDYRDEMSSKIKMNLNLELLAK